MSRSDRFFKNRLTLTDEDFLVGIDVDDDYIRQFCAPEESSLGFDSAQYLGLSDFNLPASRPLDDPPDAAAPVLDDSVAPAVGGREDLAPLNSSTPPDAPPIPEDPLLSRPSSEASTVVISIADAHPAPRDPSALLEHEDRPLPSPPNAVLHEEVPDSLRPADSLPRPPSRDDSSSTSSVTRFSESTRDDLSATTEGPFAPVPVSLPPPSGGFLLAEPEEEGADYHEYYSDDEVVDPREFSPHDDQQYYYEADPYSPNPNAVNVRSLQLQLEAIREEKLQWKLQSSRELTSVQHELKNSQALVTSLRRQCRHAQEENLEVRKERIRTRSKMNELRRKVERLEKGLSGSENQRRRQQQQQQEEGEEPMFVSTEEVRKSVQGIVDEYERKLEEQQNEAHTQIRMRNDTLRKMMKRFNELKNHLQESETLRRKMAVQLGAKGAEIGMLTARCEQRDEEVRSVKRLMESERLQWEQERSKFEVWREQEQKRAVVLVQQERKKAVQLRVSLEERAAQERTHWTSEMQRMASEREEDRDHEATVYREMIEDLRECAVDLDEVVGLSSVDENGSSGSHRLPPSSSDENDDESSSLGSLRKSLVQELSFVKRKVQIVKLRVLEGVAGREECKVQ